MARTFRNRGHYIPDWVYRTLKFEHVGGRFTIIERRLDGDELKKALARFRSDAGVGAAWTAGEPHWWRNVYERKDRQLTARQLRMFMKDPEFEVQLREKPRMDYWW